MLKELEIMKNKITERIEEKGEAHLIVSFDCEPLNIKHYNDFTIDEIILSDDKLNCTGINGTPLDIGLTDVQLEVLDNDYYFRYSNGIEVMIGVI